MCKVGGSAACCRLTSEEKEEDWWVPLAIYVTIFSLFPALPLSLRSS